MAADLNRQELIRALKAGTLTPEEIAGLPEELRLEAELLREFPFAGADRLIDAPETFIRKAEGIFERATQPGRVRAFLAKLVFDSWAMPLPTGVRGAGSADERRVRFELPPYVFDLRVEKQGGEYHCTAEVAGSAPTPEQCTVTADRKTIPIGAEGLFEWSSSRPPRRLTVQVDDAEPVALPELLWNKPPDK